MGEGPISERDRRARHNGGEKRKDAPKTYFGVKLYIVTLNKLSQIKFGKFCSIACGAKFLFNCAFESVRWIKFAPERINNEIYEQTENP